MRPNPLPPGPRGIPLLGNLPEIARDPLRFLERCTREFGDFVPFRFLNRRVFLMVNITIS